MHKPPVLMLASNNNSLHLQELGARFAAEDPPINIRSIGGGDVTVTIDNTPTSIGVFTIAIDDDTDERLELVQSIAQDLGLTFLSREGVTFELDNKPGSLGTAAGVLQANGINILSLLVIGNHGDRAIVLLGVASTQVATTAREVLEAEHYFVYPAGHDHAS